MFFPVITVLTGLNGPEQQTTKHLMSWTSENPPVIGSSRTDVHNLLIYYFPLLISFTFIHSNSEEKKHFRHIVLILYKESVINSTNNYVDKPAREAAG